MYIIPQSNYINNTYLDNPKDILVEGNYAYVLNQGVSFIGLVVLDISNKSNPLYVSSFIIDIGPSEYGGLFTLDKKEEYVYVPYYKSATSSIGNGYLSVLNVGNVDTIYEVEKVLVSKGQVGMYVQTLEDKLYLSNVYNRNNGRYNAISRII